MSSPTVGEMRLRTRVSSPTALHPSMNSRTAIEEPQLEVLLDELIERFRGIADTKNVSVRTKLTKNR